MIFMFEDQYYLIENALNIKYDWTEDASRVKQDATVPSNLPSKVTLKRTEAK